MRSLRTVLMSTALMAWATHASGQAPSAEAVRFFETEIRPTFQTQCAQCHNEKLRTSGLSVAGREGLLQGGNRGEAISLDRPAQSLILSALRQTEALRMPPGGKLPAAKVDAIERWIKMGAPWPEQSQVTSAGDPKNHWSFQPIKRPDPPEVSKPQWPRNPIDNFILARLDEAQIEPSPEADAVTLMRRAHLDLTGLLPPPAEVDDFLADNRPGAYDRLVDRLLDSPHYGERWGRHWLDIARYADSNGYNNDAPRKIWMYRDWLINALNRDLPFDQFVVEQIAGDMLDNPTNDQIVATGFHRNTLINLEGGVDFEQYRTEAVVDRVDVTGMAFLGLTLGCARCHDHKFDAVSQREFYQFFAFFNSIDELSGDYKDREGRARAYEPVLEFGDQEQHSRKHAIEAQLDAMAAEQDQYEKALLAKQPEWEASLSEEELAILPIEIQRILAKPPAERHPRRLVFVKNAYLGQDPGVQERRKAIAAVRRLLPEIPSTMVMRELPEPRKTHVLLQGEFLMKGVEVQPGTPAALPPLEPRAEASGWPGSRATTPSRSRLRADRLDLAHWLVSDDNPLTARVTVNRIWKRYFGQGIVATENDFGTQGEPPSHPKLLDWLASEFVAQGWSLKQLHRTIVTSATYRQSSDHRPDAAKKDSSNRLLARQNRLRVEAEIVRDLALSASGMLVPEIGGPGVFPSQPPDYMIRNPWRESKGKDRYRRGLYTYFWRTSPHPGLMLFDSPDSLATATSRNRSNTPLQALTLLNDTGHHEFAQGLAKRVLTERPDADNSDRIAHAFRLCLTRAPSPDEQEKLERLLANQLDDFRTRPEQADELLTLEAGGFDRAETAAWTTVAGVLMNLDEFITRE